MENFLNQHPLYVVFGIALILWIGISIYLFIIDKKITKLEIIVNDKIDDLNNIHS